MDFTNLYQTLVYLAGPVGALAWFIYASNLVRGVRESGGLLTLEAWQVQLLVMSASLAVPLAALAIVQYVPGEALAQLQDAYAIVATVAIAYIGQQVWFQASRFRPSG